MAKKKTTLVCILDGFGLNPSEEHNAIRLANTPVFDRLFAEGPSTTLTTHGLNVGLPEGQMGNSEVGHLNIGAGRVVEQWLVRINRELESGSVYSCDAYKSFMKHSQDSGTLHVFGLFSDGGVHSHLDHLMNLLPSLCNDYPGKIALHLITDGRDTSPTLAAGLVKNLESKLVEFKDTFISSIAGRFFAMDRDKRWERIEEAFRVYESDGSNTKLSPAQYLESCYSQDITDEFVPPVSFSSSAIGAHDSLLFYNFRDDRMREIVSALCLQDFSHFTRTIPQIPAERVLCFTEYDSTFNLPVLFSKTDISDHLGETVAKAGLTQLRVAETEKYPHVTYFLNGGIEEPYPGESRKLIPSPRDVKTYDQKPEMSAYEVTEVVTSALTEGSFDLIIVNLANCDMVGHTGDLQAAIHAAQTVDECLGKMLSAVDLNGGQALIFADHGNAELMVDPKTGTPHTAHTTFPVPCLLYGYEGAVLRKGGALCDVAPTALELIGLDQPKAMTGTSLITRES